MAQQKRSPIDTDEYRAQRDEWYARLAEEGFEDQEMIDRRTGLPGDRLRGPSPGDLRRSRHRIMYVRETERFYALCRQHVWDMPKGLNRDIFARFAEGARPMEIWRELQADPHTAHVTKAFVRRSVRRSVEDVRVEALRAQQDPGPVPEDVEVLLWGSAPEWDL